MATALSSSVPSEVAAINLSLRYEQRLLEGGGSRPRPIPAVIITGFLGAGKTTLVQHILRNRGSLRIAVLVNEVGQVDVDSELVNAKQGHAALGLSAADLSGGCVCCSKSEDLLAALHRIRDPSSAHLPPPYTPHPHTSPSSAVAPAAPPPDYLVVETSGAADAGPLAAALAAAGFRLDCVVAVVDAEAGRQALADHPVAAAQLAAADVVVLNKCDLLAAAPGGGLGALADMEDELARRAPGVRVVRARYGEVPLPTVLDVEPVEGARSGSIAAAAAAAGAAGDGAGGGFMSHESMPVGAAGGFRLAAGPLAVGGLAVGSSKHTRRRAAPPGSGEQHAAQGEGHGQPHDHPHGHTHSHDHGRLHSGFHTESVVAAEGPVSLGAVACFVLRHVVREPALLRCKGFVWAAERRRHRLTLHVSGRRRAEAAQEGPWEGPPATQLVFIGTDATAMARLRDAFIAEVVQGAGPGSAAQRPAGQAGDGGSGAGKGSCEAQGESTPGVLEEWIREHERLVLVETLHPPSSAARGVGGGGGGDDAVASSAHTGARELWPGGSTVVFSARGSPLHGISPEEVNQDIALRANAAGGLLLVAVTAPGQVSAATLVQRRDRVVALLVPPTGPPEALRDALAAAAEPVLRKAYQHVHNCKCDVAAAAQGMK